MIIESEFRKGFKNDPFAINFCTLTLVLLTFGGPTLLFISYIGLYFYPPINNYSFSSLLVVIIDLVLFCIFFPLQLGLYTRLQNPLRKLKISQKKNIRYT